MKSDHFHIVIFLVEKLSVYFDRRFLAAIDEPFGRWHLPDHADFGNDFSQVKGITIVGQEQLVLQAGVRGGGSIPGSFALKTVAAVFFTATWKRRVSKLVLNETTIKSRKIL